VETGAGKESGTRKEPLEKTWHQGTLHQEEPRVKGKEI